MIAFKGSAVFVLLLLQASPDVGMAQDALPFTLTDNLVRLSASVNDHPVSAVLDSGTSVIMVDRAAAVWLGLNQGAVAGSAAGGGAGDQSLTALSIDRLKAGALELSDVHGLAMDLSPFSSSAGFPVEALLGGPAFLGRKVEVDYKASRVVFAPADQPLNCANPIPLTLASGVPIVEVELKDDPASPQLRLRLVVDLGTRYFAAMLGGRFLDTEVGRALLEKSRPQKIGVGTGGLIDGSVVRVDSITIGAQQFTDLPIALTRQIKAMEAGFADGTLGVPLWKSGTIAFDYPHGRLCIAR